jgi:hypothetical protein
VRGGQAGPGLLNANYWNHYGFCTASQQFSVMFKKCRRAHQDSILPIPARVSQLGWCMGKVVAITASCMPKTGRSAHARLALVVMWRAM